MMEEVFKVIAAYPDYMIGSNGTVLSVYTLNAHGKHLRSTPFKLKDSISNAGYKSVFLGSQKNGEAKRLSVHRLVAEAFIPNHENKPQVNHINGIKTDNRAVNLEWATCSENWAHAYKSGLIKRRSGDNATYRKISSDIAKQIRSLYPDKNQKEIAAMFCIHPSLVSLVVNNKRW